MRTCFRLFECVGRENSCEEFIGNALLHSLHSYILASASLPIENRIVTPFVEVRCDTNAQIFWQWATNNFLPIVNILKSYVYISQQTARAICFDRHTRRKFPPTRRQMMRSFLSTPYEQNFSADSGIEIRNKIYGQNHRHKSPTRNREIIFPTRRGKRTCHWRWQTYGEENSSSFFY